MPAEEARPQEAEVIRRLFFALWPDESMRQAMVRATAGAAQASGGRAVPAANLHVTLAFLGSVPLRRQSELAAAARQSALAPAATPLELRFDRLQFWRQAQVLCAAPADPPAWTAAVAGRLQARLIESGFAPDLKPFRPHVTVVRKVVRAGTSGEMPAVLWRFTELALIESRTLPVGPLYSVVEAYPLCSGKKVANDGETPSLTGFCGRGFVG